MKQTEEKFSAIIKRFEKQIKYVQIKSDEGQDREKMLETENKELKDENKKINNELKEFKKGDNMVKYEKARLEEGNLLDICYILDKMNKLDQSLKEHDVKGIIKYTSV
jgi:predicted nuclease with TOPRIM domain